MALFVPVYPSRVKIIYVREHAGITADDLVSSAIAFGDLEPTAKDICILMNERTLEAEVTDLVLGEAVSLLQAHSLEQRSHAPYFHILFLIFVLSQLLESLEKARRLLEKGINRGEGASVLLRGESR